ncbi:hypothetical protein ACFVVQ_27415 [Paenibacillus chitinolyticus]|uniref:hypothetical protein n=1 Tax=Paenibacillus chitinolyticus TaxID=79263 RepID=UPI0036D91A7E
MDQTLILWSPELKKEIKSEKLKNANSTARLSVEEILKQQLEKNKIYKLAWC